MEGVVFERAWQERESRSNEEEVGLELELVRPPVESAREERRDCRSIHSTEDGTQSSRRRLRREGEGEGRKGKGGREESSG